VKVPKRPNTKPAIAIAAINVIAMSITVAKTGEIPLLRLALWIFNLVVAPYEATAENARGEPLATTREPDTAAPEVNATLSQPT